MTRNQLHGKKFEDLIKGCGLFPGASDQSRQITAYFDVEARFDRRLHIPTSIKSTGDRTVSLSDARRFWRIDHSFRMLVGRYRQEQTRKLFYEVHEFVLKVEALDRLHAGIAPEAVTRWHDGIGLSRYPAGMHDQARAWIREELKGLAPDARGVSLNPKIDTRNQRRLQCSVRLDALIAVTADQGAHTAHAEQIGDLVLPFALVSSAREFRKDARA